MQRTPTHAMPALHANNGAFPFRRAFIHAWRGSTCRPRSTPTNSRMVATHQEQPMPFRQIAGTHDHPSTAPSREMRFHFRPAFIHAWRGSTCRPRSTPTNSRMVDTHQEQPMPFRQIAGTHDHPSTAPSREMRFHSRPAFIHAWRGSTCRPRSTPTNSSVVDTHQQQREPVEGGVGPVAGA